MSETFQRREGSVYPQVHHIFTAKDRDNDELVEYSIEDLTVDQIDSAIFLFVEFMFPVEVFPRAAKIFEKPKSYDVLVSLHRWVLNQQTSLACFNAKTRELVGLNSLHVKTKAPRRKTDVGDAALNDMIEAFDFADSTFDPFEHFNVDRFLSASGLIVKPEYRKRGIATEILKARAPLLKSLHLTVTSTLFSMNGSQRAAVAAGYNENQTVSYKEVQQKYPKLDFSYADSTHCRIMSLTVEAN